MSCYMSGDGAALSVKNNATEIILKITVEFVLIILDMQAYGLV